MAISSITRRRLLHGAAMAALAASFTPGRARAAQEHAITLVAGPGRQRIVGTNHPQTETWSYNGTAPGPVLRLRQGDRLHVTFENRLREDSTIHWHGVRVPNAMDGVPDLTQKPVARGESFAYEFELPDAGTFWYHPHARSFEQVERGLAGALIVEEPTPPAVDRDVTWVLDDWRLDKDAAISPDFGSFMDMSHAGRLGNTVTINGTVPDAFAVRAGERLRLRLINVANARIFGLTFEGHRPWLIALDGQPVAPHLVDSDRIVLGPAMRADLIIDMAGEPGARHRVVDSFYRSREYRLVDLAYGPEPPLRPAPAAAPAALPDNPLWQPDLAAAERHRIELGGGMMDPRLMRIVAAHGRDSEAFTAAVNEMRAQMREGRIWTINGVAVRGHLHAPLLTLRHGRSYVFDMLNDTAWHHPMHLHGMTFQVLSRNGQTLPRRVWQDTVLMDPGERAEIAFVADNPGDWMFHCHILEHQESGMMGTVRVA